MRNETLGGICLSKPRDDFTNYYVCTRDKFWRAFYVNRFRVRLWSRHEMLRIACFLVALLGIASTAIQAEIAAENPKPDGSPIEYETLPASRGGQDLIGKPMMADRFDRWVGTAESQQEFIENGKVILYRWWTDTCPYCEASLPAIESLRKKYEDRGLRTVAVYHPKTPRPVSIEAVSEKAREFGYHGAIAADDDWSILREIYLLTGNRSATSVSFLVDAEGIIRFVHPGPAYFPSTARANKQENYDFVLLDRAIEALLQEAEGRSADSED